MDDVDLDLAREIIEAYPEDTAGLSVAEVATAWVEHDKFCHGTDRATPDADLVAGVMNQWRTHHPLGVEVAALRAEVARLEAIIIDLRGELSHDGPVADILFRADRPCNPASDGRLRAMARQLARARGVVAEDTDERSCPLPLELLGLARRSLPARDFASLVAGTNEVRDKTGE